MMTTETTKVTTMMTTTTTATSKAGVLLLALYGFVLLAACAPKIYVIDNQTVLEQSAAGEWPEFEKRLLEKAKAKGPTPLSQVPISTRKKKLYNVLNDSMGLEPAEAGAATDAAAAKAN